MNLSQFTETPPPCTEDEYLAWRRDPLTQQLFVALFNNYLSTDEPLPLTVESAALQAHNREGYLVAANFVLDWKPEIIE
jgi:hypothetical protein